MADLPYNADGLEVKLLGQDSSGNTLNYVGADANGNMYVRDVSGAAPGATAPASALQVGGTDGTNLRALLLDSSGRAYVNIYSPIPAGTNTIGSLNNISGTISLPTGAATSALQTSGNSSLSSIATNTAGFAQDTIATGTITAVNGTVAVASQAGNAITVSITGTFSANLVAEGQLADGTWVSLVLYQVSTTLPYPAATTILGASTYMIIGGAYTNVRMRATSYTSGTINVAFDASSAQQGVFAAQLGAWSTTTTGNTPSAFSDSGNPVKIGGVYNATLPTLSSGYRVDLQTDANGRALVAATPLDGSKATYSASFTNMSIVATTPTDFFIITGSATKTIRVLRIAISGSQTTAGQRDILLIKRSSANSGGTSTAAPIVPHDSNSPAGTATVLGYTTNPTVGTAVGTVRVARLFFATATTDSDNWFWDFGTRPSQAIVLRGAAQGLALNANSIAAAGTTVDINIEWTEDNS